MSSGIYTITNLINNKIYVGSSTRNIENRLKEHRYYLDNKNHHNQHLQNAWNKYKEEDFEFEVLEECDSDLCIWLEKYWINILDTKNIKKGYNINDPITGNYNVPCREETKKKISNTKVLRESAKGTNNPNYGNIWSKEIKLQNKLSQKTRKEVLKYTLSGELIDTFDSIRDAARSINNIKKASCISKACNYPNNYKTISGFVWKFKK